MECNKAKIGISYSGPGAMVIGNGVLWGALIGFCGIYSLPCDFSPGDENKSQGKEYRIQNNPGVSSRAFSSYMRAVLGYYLRFSWREGEKQFVKV